MLKAWLLPNRGKGGHICHAGNASLSTELPNFVSKWINAIAMTPEGNDGQGTRLVRGYRPRSSHPTSGRAKVLKGGRRKLEQEEEEQYEKQLRSAITTRPFVCP